RLELLVPHVRRAVAIGKVIDMHRIDAEILADAVDTLSAGVFLVDHDGCVVRANAAARAMVTAADMLYLDDGVLTVRGVREEHQALTEAIAGAVRDDLVVSPRGVAIPLTGGNGDRHVAHLLPLTTGARGRGGRAARAGAAVFVHKAAIGGLLPMEAIARQFGL